MTDAATQTLEALALSRTKLRFTSATTEAEFRVWLVEQGIPMTRFGMQVSVFNWLVALATIYLVPSAHRAVFTGLVVFVVLPLIVGTLLLTYRPSRRAWIEPLTAITTAVAGLSCVAAAFWSIEQIDVSASAVVLIATFAFTIFPMRVPLAVAGVAAFLGFHELLLCHSYFTGTLSFSSTLIYSLGPVLGSVSGCLANALIERGSRERFRQGKIIESQRRTIERERARADVAERSRELADALTRLTDAGTPPRLIAGDVIEDKYRVIAPVGRGGMAEVHEVEQLSDGKRLALKVLTGKIDREALLRFAREARIAASLDHPNVVDVVEVGVAPAGMFLVMELIDGENLAAVREQYGDVAWALPLLRQIAGALAALHDRGVVHRDLKPGNILLDGATPKLTDFGIATLSDAPALPQIDVQGGTAISVSDLGLTRTGAILGTPLYMAPELTAGSRDAPPATDLWSFGVIAHELLTRSHPFPEPPVLARLAGRPFPAPRKLTAAIDEELRAVLERCLAQDPAQRPSAATVRDALSTVSR